jgi:2-oxoglutarate dehydrogenase E2 component (dihydrolipoamide succinyltransferase)
MGVSAAEGTLAEWRKQPGDWVAYEETICLISTDKIDTDVPSPAAGRVAELVVSEGETVEVGAVLARIATDARPGEPHASERVVAPRRYSPVVARMAAEHGIDLERVAGTGRDGRVRKQDIVALLAREQETAQDAPSPAPVEQGESEEPPLHIESPYRADDPAPVVASTEGLSRMRRAIGEHMKRSQETAATVTTWIEVDFSRVETVRRRLGMTALPLVARATIESLAIFGSLNATWDGDTFVRHDAVHMGIAVSLGEDGLIVPIIRDSQDLSAEGLAKRIKDLARRARKGELTPDDVRDGTFTITNPGQFGSVMATPIIHQPQVGILDIEAVVKRPVVVTGPDGEDVIAIRPICILGLSWDHRALDGAQAASFLAELKQRLESLV